jgi:hypothetical protein
MNFKIVAIKQENKKKKAPFIHHVLQHHQSKKPIIVSPLFEWNLFNFIHKPQAFLHVLLF